MNSIKIIIISFLLSGNLYADGYHGMPITQTFNYNQGFHTDWYNSPLGMGAAQAGVGLVYGLINVMSRPDPVIIQQPYSSNPNQVSYPQNNSGYSNPNYGYGQSMCIDKTIYDANGNSRVAKVCE